MVTASTVGVGRVLVASASSLIVVAAASSLVILVVAVPLRFAKIPADHVSTAATLVQVDVAVDDVLPRLHAAAVLDDVGPDGVE